MSSIDNKNTTDNSIYYKEKKQKARLQQKWMRLIKQWGHDDAALDDLYNEGDNRHGKGFTSFLDSVVVHRDIIETVSQRPKETGLFDILQTIQEETNTPSPKMVSFSDIMKEQASGV